MPDVIRLVCPECDAVHRVKSITLGKLYRCKKCKSGLITMSPAVLACPSCNATKPPAHIEVSQLITCDECAQAPLMTVRFTTPQRNHRQLVEMFEETPRPKPAPQRPQQQQQETSATQEDDTPPVIAGSAPAAEAEPAPAVPDQPIEPAALAEPAESVEPPKPVEPKERVAQEDSQPTEIKPEQTAAAEASSTLAEDEAYPPPASESVTDFPAQNGQAHIAGEDIEESVSQSASENLPPEPLEEPRITGPDTRRREGFGREPDFPPSLSHAPLYVSPEPYRETDLGDDLGLPPEDLHLSANRVPVDEQTLKRLLVQLQEPLVKQLENSPRSIPIWIPLAMAVLLFALYGWLLGEMDGLRQDLKSSRQQMQQTESNLQAIQVNFLEERKRLHAIISEYMLEKKRMENDMEELNNRNRQLRQQMLNLPGPEIDIGE